MTQKITRQVAYHDPSRCVLIDGDWKIDYTDLDIIQGGQTDYRHYVDIVDENDEGYNPDDPEQEHDGDYSIIEVEVEVDYTLDDEEEYNNYVERHSDNRNEYYGHCMNGGGGYREFSKMYGNGDHISFEGWLINKKF